ncbi:hypothetical protein M0804_015554 [Polistes exclamans]|nr:hypothetical protein M0804_015554 [Polistes exclamans]
MRRIIPSSEEDDCLIIEPDAASKSGGSNTQPLSTLEAGRLLDRLRVHLMETEKLWCSNLKGEVSGKMERLIKEALIMADEIERLDRQSGSPFSEAEAVIQLRTEAKLQDEKIREMEEEKARLIKELKKHEAATQSQGVKTVAAPSQGKQVLPAGGKATSALEKRLEDARAGDNEESVMAMLREVNRSIEALQRDQAELWNAFNGTSRPPQRGTDVVGKTAEGGKRSAPAPGTSRAPAPGTSRAPAPRIPAASAAAPPQDGFIEVVGRKKHRLQTEPAVRQEKATTPGERARKVGEQNKGERSATGSGTKNKKKKKKKKKSRSGGTRETAAVSLICHETAGARSLSLPVKTFPQWNARAADEDMLAAALISGDWTRPSGVCSARVYMKWLREVLVSACDMALPRERNTRDKGSKACWWSQELSALRAAATAARRRFLKARRSGDQRRIELCLEARRETKRLLKRAIKRAKAMAWRDFVGTLEADPWGNPDATLVMGKLRPYSAPLTEVLEPDVLDRVLGGLFPQVERNSAQDVRGVQVDGAAVTPEEVLAAAKRITGGKAPGPDGVPGMVIKAAAVHCGVGLAELFTECFRTSNFPAAWKRARLYRAHTRVNYLGVVLDSDFTFRPHFAALIPKAEGILRSLGRLLPNLHGLGEKKRRLYGSVIQSVLHYGAPVWWRAAAEDSRVKRAIRSFQRRVAIRVCCAYRTVSFHAVMMVAGIIPLDHLAPQLAEAYAALRDAEGPVLPSTKAALGAIARRRAIAAWKEEELGLIGVTGETGTQVRAAIAGRLDEWVERPYSIGTTFHTTQLMTGHGCFPAYLYRIGKAAFPQCFHCGVNADDADHTLVDCPAWMDERDGLVRDLGGVHVSLSGIVRASLDMPGGWAAFRGVGLTRTPFNVRLGQEWVSNLRLQWGSYPTVECA